MLGRCRSFQLGESTCSASALACEPSRTESPLDGVAAGEAEEAHLSESVKKLDAAKVSMKSSASAKKSLTKLAAPEYAY